MNKVEKIIRTIRESFVGSVTVYTKGSCYGFHKILKEIFPDAVAFYKDEHIVSKIDNKYYDITGEVKENFIPLDEVAELFQELIKDNRFIVTE
ncbi:hypothetical protein [Poseidonibacter ostreae]|uniref:Uncharacterized protein n=1 Tax=Poseidonibacter ostreae TaxID=2654171 RepID=A0A6L4WWL9_9BACT|nr:hypothetical protein [Poseidonibacter ostreae]KAB7891426.1 hypothetical protein GBG19_00895 [Poseidonibacter ostreae]